MTGIEMIAVERERQIQQEGWTPQHDDQHANDELVISGAAYALYDVYRMTSENLALYGCCKPLKPKDPIHNLVRAGALIAAEIDRRQRLASE